MNYFYSIEENANSFLKRIHGLSHNFYFHHPSWIKNTWEIIEKNRDSKFFGVICEGHDGIIAYWPLILSKRGLGYRLQNIGQEISDYACPSYQAKNINVNTTCLLGMLSFIESHKKQFSFVQFNNFLPPNNFEPKLVTDFLEKLSSWSVSNTKDNYYIDSAKYQFSSENWFSNRLSKNVRKNIRHESNVLTKLGHIKIENYQNQDQLRSIKSQYYEWYQYQKKSNIFDLKKLDVWWQVYLEMVGSNHLLVSVLHLDTQPISLIFGFYRDNEFDLFSLCYDPKYSKYSPGKQHLFQLINQTIDKKIQKINFLTGNEPYKISYASDCHKTYDLKFYHTANFGGFIQFMKK